MSIHSPPESKAGKVCVKLAGVRPVGGVRGGAVSMIARVSLLTFIVTLWGLGSTLPAAEKNPVWTAAGSSLLLAPIQPDIREDVDLPADELKELFRLYAAGLALLKTNRHREAGEVFRRAGDYYLDAVERLVPYVDSADPHLEILNLLGVCLVGAGQGAEALERLTEALELAKREQPAQIPTITLNLAVAHGGVGNLDDQLALSKEAARSARESQQHSVVVGAELQLAAALLARGESAEAEALPIFEEVRSQSTDEGLRDPANLNVAYSLCGLGLAALKEGRVEDAAAHLRRCADIQAAGTDRGATLRVLVLPARALRAGGRTEEELETLQQALPLLDSAKTTELGCTMHARLGKLAGDTERADELEAYTALREQDLGSGTPAGP
jgi:tetratricopeptide (TPR) repeat protein